MTVARENIAPPPGVSLSPLAARLELLLRRAITMDQFEADMVSCCEAHPDEIWNLLALLDQYHRLERLPTELYRELRAAADRYGLVRREPYIPPAAATPAAATSDAAQPAPDDESDVELPAPVAAPAKAPVPPVAATQATPPVMTPTPAPTAALANPSPANRSTADANDTPFRHLLDDAPTTTPAIQATPAANLRVDSTPVMPTSLPSTSTTWQGSRYSPPTPPAKRRSRVRALLLPALLVAVALGAAAWLKQGQGSVDMLAGPEDAAQRAANTAAVPTPAPPATTAATTAPATAAPVPAPSVELEPPVPAGPPPSPVASAAAPTHSQPAAPPPASVAPKASAPATPATASPAAPTAARSAPPPVATSPAPPVAATAAPLAAVAPKSTPAAAVATSPAAASGPAMVELASGSYTVRSGDSAARIVVRRSGSPNGDLGFTWWTENATAVADVDYVAWGKRAEKIPAGRSSVTLLVPIINDSTRTAPRQFQVVIGRADNGAALGATTHATVQLTN